jgi:predicted hydrocarbon binding protein
MTHHEREPVCCGSEAQSFGGLVARDFATLDQAAVKLICADGRFSEPAKQMGRLLGERIAIERGGKLLCLDEALSTLVSACGCECALHSHFLQKSPDGALLQITGCATVLGWEIPSVNRTVCGFDAGLFEGFLSSATGKSVGVEETACLGLGDSSCEFEITLHPAQAANSEQEGV